MTQILFRETILENRQMAVIGILMYYYWTILLLDGKTTTELKLDAFCMPGPYLNIDALPWIIIDEFEYNANVSSSCTWNIFCFRFIQFFWLMNTCIRWYFQLCRNRNPYIPKQECVSFMQTYIFVFEWRKMTRWKLKTSLKSISQTFDKIDIDSSVKK